MAQDVQLIASISRIRINAPRYRTSVSRQLRYGAIICFEQKRAVHYNQPHRRFCQPWADPFAFPTPSSHPYRGTLPVRM